jgi:hypothetical protein
LVLEDHEGPDWELLMNLAFTARKRITIFLNDILEKDKPSYLQKAFEYESQLAGLVKINISLAEKRDITDTLNKPKYHYPSYEEILLDKLLQDPNPGKFNKIEEFQEAIRKFVVGNKEK